MQAPSGSVCDVRCVPGGAADLWSGPGGLGDGRRGLDITLPVHDTVYSRTLGEKYYELSDQLGSARMVISDRKLSEIVGGVPGKYRAEVKTFANLYPYEMEEPGRYMAGDAYRYGYQGMEKDSTSGGERYTTMFRTG